MPSVRQENWPAQQWPKSRHQSATREYWPGMATQQHNRPSLGCSLPYCLRSGMEAISKLGLQRVRVHYNSPLPAKVQAHAYAQGLNIYLAPGQSHHLPHELGHVVQQLSGMVQATTTVNGMAVNDDPKLEDHATELGDEAVRVGKCKRGAET
ncbi:MAG: hypothetical protein COA42_19160 [Alteromonadaceae bacterium]|nr:MAG: hypothetical protein COA42_19160 [Alteromonadaceae bacterium]